MRFSQNNVFQNGGNDILSTNYPIGMQFCDVI